MKKIEKSNFLWDHQKEALRALENHKEDISLVVLPTGTGKSIVAFLTPYVLKAHRVIVITPSAVITTQLMRLYSGNDKSFGELKIFSKKSHLEQPKQIVKAKELLDNEGSLLTIVNAHKFGTTADIDIGNISDDVDLVIIDEAHHYPAQTWTSIVEHFCYSKKVFLTATPYNRGEYIVEQKYIAYNSLSPNDAISKGYLRPVDPITIGNLNDNEAMQIELLATEVMNQLKEHDKQDSTIKHQAMILTYKKSEAKKVVEAINNTYPQAAAEYCGMAPKTVVNEFEENKHSVLVVCGKLLEGYDRKSISVLGIHRNVQPASRVLYTQFLGRCLRKVYKADPVRAKVISHIVFNQLRNFNQLNILSEEDPVDDNKVNKELEIY